MCCWRNGHWEEGHTDAIHSAISRAAVPLEKSKIMVMNTNSPKLHGSTAGLNLSQAHNSLSHSCTTHALLQALVVHGCMSQYAHGNWTSIA